MTRSTVRTLILDAVAAHRMTRLVTLDVIFAEPRAAVIRWAYTRQAEANGKSLRSHLHEALAAVAAHGPEDLTPVEWEELAMSDDNAPKVATLITCRWCASVYLAAGIVIARRFAPRFWDPVARAAALSSVSALLARVED